MAPKSKGKKPGVFDLPPMTKEEKAAAKEENKDKTPLQLTLAKIKATFAKTNVDIIYNPNQVIQAIPSGDVMYDIVSQVGGFPRKRITELFGMEHSGKSSLVYAALGKLQQIALKLKAEGKPYRRCCLIDNEGAFDVKFAKDTFNLVVDQDTFLLFQPDNAEETDKIIDILLFKNPQTGKRDIDNIDMLAFDSIDAMKPKAIIEASLTDGTQKGAQAQAVGRIVAKIRIAARQMNFAAVFINQMRMIIQMGQQTEQNCGTGAGFNVQEKHTTSGGYAPRFYASIRMKLEYGGQIQDKMGVNLISQEADEHNRIGNMIKVINVKNKLGTPFLKGLTNFDFVLPGQKGGWNTGRTCLTILEQRAKVRMEGRTLVYDGYKIPKWTHVGPKEECIKAFINDPVAVADAEALVRSMLMTFSETLAKVEPGELKPEDFDGQDDPNVVKELNLTDLGIDADKVLQGECVVDDGIEVIPVEQQEI